MNTSITKFFTLYFPTTELFTMYSGTSLIWKIIVLISEVSLFQAENNMYLYKVGTQSSVLSKQGVLISEVSFKRGSTVFSNNRTVQSSA